MHKYMCLDKCKFNLNMTFHASIAYFSRRCMRSNKSLRQNDLGNMMWNTKSLFAALAWKHTHTQRNRKTEERIRKIEKKNWHVRQFAYIIKHKYFLQTTPNHAIQFMLFWLWAFRLFFRHRLIRRIGVFIMSNNYAPDRFYYYWTVCISVCICACGCSLRKLIKDIFICILRSQNI